MRLGAVSTDRALIAAHFPEKAELICGLIDCDPMVESIVQDYGLAWRTLDALRRSGSDPTTPEILDYARLVGELAAELVASVDGRHSQGTS
ncbi:MAG: hypothetical protein EA406_04500 [Rhodospirillales bacterium]|nr:MAG: hypothetical protein EA406_04500 [Rhodospirillales bacterium]